MGLYAALLHLFPRAFRAEYGGEMAADFAARRRAAAGPLALLRLWLEMATDLVWNAAAEHLEILRRDLRYTARALSRAPGFVATAVLVVALGVGANTAAFSVADFVLLRPLPFPEPERLVNLWERLPGYSHMELSPPNYRDWQGEATVFESMGAYYTQAVNLVGAGEPVRLEGAAVTADLLPTLGVKPLLGRLFAAGEDQWGVGGTVLLSYGLWQSRFAGDPHVLGQRLELDGAPYEVIGVMPRDFSYPRRDGALWTAMQISPDDSADRTNNYLHGVARLRPGVSLADAQAEMSVVAARLEKAYPKENEQTGAYVVRLRDELPSQVRLLLLALCGAALCILLIACANLASLLLARTLARQKELAVRTALGAGQERLVRQLLTESVVLAVLGGGLGVAVAAAAVPLLSRLVPDALPVAQGPALDLRVLLFAALLTALTGIGFGVLPALRACRDVDLNGLRDGTRTSGGRKQRLRSVLVVTEVTASVVLLISTGLLLRALWRVEAVNPGFRVEGVLTLRTALPWNQYKSTAKRVELYERVLSEIRALPGVSSAAYISFLPMTMTGGIWPVILDGETANRQQDHVASLRFVTPGFFETLAIPLQRGRVVDRSDGAAGQRVAVVSESFARQFLPDRDPIGQRFQLAFQERTVVGVVGDIMVRGLERPSEPQVYLPAPQVADDSLVFYSPKDLVVRSSADPAQLLPAIRRIVAAADPELPISEVRTMREVVRRQTASRSAQVRLLAVLAAIAFLLAGVGIHGLLSFTVSNRAQEIGVRMALGARPGQVVGMVVRQGMRLTLAGVLPGVALAYAAGRAMEALLANVRPGDGSTFLAVVGLCLAMAAAGCLFPALRAARVDPLSALRAE